MLLATAALSRALAFLSILSQLLPEAEEGGREQHGPLPFNSFSVASGTSAPTLRSLDGRSLSILSQLLR